MTNDKNDSDFPLIKELKDGHAYICRDWVFVVNGDYTYDIRGTASIPYHWLVDIKTEEYHKSSSCGLPKNMHIREASLDEYFTALKISEKKAVSFENVERLINESRQKLDEAMTMLNSLKNGQQR